ncbi:MAG TPA: PAS domain S-box protein [Bacteroidales bacterium]|nr:PAS domain S-box protein [Bacteroidales bacterium]
MKKNNNSFHTEIDLFTSLSYMVANTDSIFFSIDRDYRYTGFNKKHVAIMQKLYAKEPQIGYLLSQIMSPADWFTAKSNIDRALSGECFSVESFSGEKNLDRRYFRISHSPVLSKSGEISGVIVIAQDLTKQHDSETALRESEERYRIITENTVDTITVLDLNLNLIYISPSVFNLRGYTVEEALKQTVDEIFTPSSLVQIRKLYKEQIDLEAEPGADPKRTSELILEENCKDGSTIWVEIVFSFIRDLSLKATGILTVTRDITARRKSEQRIRQLAAIVESSDDAIFSKTLDGIITSWNKGAEEIYGYREDEIIGKSIEILMPAEIKEEIPNLLSRIKKGEHIDHYTTVRTRKDGQRIDVSLTISPMYDLNGTIMGASTIASDISSRVRAEEILRESEIKYRTLVEKITAGVIVHRGDTSIEISNSMADELLGLSHEQMLDKTIHDLSWDFIRENGTVMPPAEYPVCQVISSGKALRNAVAGINRQKNNDVVWVLVNADPVFNRQNKIIQVIVTFIDISARKEAEKAVKQAHDELEIKVGQRTAELSLANHQLAALNKIGQVITAPLHLKDVLDSITFNTARLLGTDTGVILLLDEKGEYLTIKGAYGLSDNVVNGTRDRVGESIAGRVVQSGEPIIANDLMHDERFSNPTAGDEGLLACASVPLIIDGRIIGTLDIHSKTNPDAFGPQHLHLMKMLASQAAIAIEKARLFEELNHAREELELKVSQRTAELFSMNEKLQDGISELKRTEQALWESSQMLKLVLNNMPAFVFWKDRNSVYLGCNYLFAENAGLSSTEICGKTDFDLPWKLTEAESYRSDDQFVMKTGVPKLNYEETQLTADGRNTWVRTSKIPLKSPEGEIIGVLGTFEDITEKRRVEHELQQSNELLTQMNRSLRMLSNSNQVLIHTSDENILLSSICRNIVETGGYIHTWVGLTEPGNNNKIHSVIHIGEQIKSESIQIEKETDVNPFQRSMRTKTPVIINDTLNDKEFGSFFTHGKDYGYRSLISLPLINLDEVLGVLVIYSADVDAFNDKEYKILAELSDDLAFGISSSRSRAKKKLAEDSLRLLSKALESAANSIVITDNEARIIWANQAFSYLTGYALDEAIGKSPRELVYSGMQNREYYQKMWKTIQEGQVWYGEIINRRKDGSLYNEFLTITPVRDEKDHISHFIAVKQDITDQKKSADELFLAKEKAEESNRLKSAFLATMNHELRTPLNHIIGFSDLIRSGTMVENVPDYAEIIHRSSLNLLEIIESIFELAVAEQSDIKLRLQTIKCLDLFISNKSILNEILEISGKREQIELIFNADKDLLLQTITTDTNKINQVLVNLFKNAVKFTHSGKIEFGLLTEKEGWLTFYVEDTGIGIPENKHKIIFEFFRQADDTHTREYGGVGIGLAISLKIAEVMNGSLSVESIPGEGSRFNFRIPAMISAVGFSTDQDHDNIIHTPGFHGMKIILAEDDPMSMELVKNYLSGTFVTIIEAKNGKEVIENLDDHVNLILMDLNMPVMDGYMATKAIKLSRPDLPVLALTAYALSSDKTKAHEAGCDSIISKPVDKRILFEEMKKYLAG